MRCMSGGGGLQGVARVGRERERFSLSLSPAAGLGWLLLGADKADSGRVGWSWVGWLSDCAACDLAG